VSFGNLIRATAEINESIFPIRQLARDYETDSGGAGEFRGNCGSLYRKQVLAPSTIYTYVVGKKYPMPGMSGGKDGSPNRLVTRAGTAQASAVGELSERVPHEPGESYEYHYGGGGGWGDPLAREPQAVLDDVLDEYVSVEGAARDYGVVLTGSLADLTLAVDEAATAGLRAERQAERQGAAAATTAAATTAAATTAG
jgi:N-methylhydantoinase B